MWRKWLKEPRLSFSSTILHFFFIFFMVDVKWKFICNPIIYGHFNDETISLLSQLAEYINCINIDGYLQ